MVYIYGTQSPNVQVPGHRLYLARVPVSQLTTFSAWQFYTGAGTWAAGQHDAEPVQPPGSGLRVSSGFSVIKVGEPLLADPGRGDAGRTGYRRLPGQRAVGPVRLRRRKAAVPGPDHRALRRA